MIRLHRNALDGWTLRGADTIGPPSLSLFRGTPRGRLVIAARGTRVDSGGLAVWARLPFTGISVRLHLTRRARHCLWGARRGDLQLGRRTDVQMLAHPFRGIPRGATCVGYERARAAAWFWIPIT